MADTLSEDQCTPLARVWVNVNRMLHNRGYAVPLYEHFSSSAFPTTVQAITGKDESQWIDLAFEAYRSNGNVIVVIFWHGSFGVKNLTPVIHEVLSRYANGARCHLDQVLIIHSDDQHLAPNVSHQVQKIMNKLRTHIPIRVFSRAFFHIDKASHDLTPVYTRVASFDETRMRCRKDQLPKMYTTDPMAQYYAFQPGDVVCVEYPDLYVHMYVS